MDFRIADTFTDSLARLAAEEQKQAKTTAFDLQMNPANPGMSFHKLDSARDKRFWSVRVSSDLRIIVHRSDESLLLCYVGHHDDAYHWAERRRLEAHPTTGAAQLVVIRETVKDVIIPNYVDAPQPTHKKPILFAAVPDNVLLGYGVPLDWLEDVRKVDEDSLLELAVHLPKEASEALLELAVGGKPQPVKLPVAVTNPFEHPDALRRFRIMGNLEELQQALDYPWERWTVFLHPDQRALVERSYNGPVRVAGSAGTGKTVVALHRAVFLARKNRDARILLTTFSDPLAQALQTKLYRLADKEPRVLERIEVRAISDVGKNLYTSRFGRPNLIPNAEVRALVKEIASTTKECKFSERFLWSEWHDVVDAWQLSTWEEYKDVPRLGRKTRLGEKQRVILWSVYSAVRERLASQKLLTEAGMFCVVADHMKTSNSAPYDFAIVDEAQDIGVPELRLLSIVSSNRADGLFFAGDLGQRIFQPPFSWKYLGVDVRGRSFTLRINYRTSHQIRRQADRLLPAELSDVDGNNEDRRGAISVFNGPEPTISLCDGEAAEIQYVANWLKNAVGEGGQPYEIGVFVRSSAQLARAESAIISAGLRHRDLIASIQTLTDRVSVGTMHLAKGLEFKAVVVMACDDEVIPLQERIESVSDDADLEDVYNTERQLLYVACTRARDKLLISCMAPGSEFLGDFGESQ